MKIDFVIGEKHGSAVTGTSILRLQTDNIEARDRLWIETQDNDHDSNNFGLTRTQARALGTRLLRWANR